MAEPVEDAAVDEETILSESSSEDERTIRVYDRRGDFIITVPAGAKVTFGYFNPASHGATRQDTFSHSPNVSVQTALRIYEKGEKGNQLACFLAVNGFRDEQVKLTRLSQRVVIETGYSDDGEGNVDANRKERRQIVAAPEPDTYQ